ncbi:hypothetical protein EC930624_3873 [Escherichia coli 93.0624]|nr:hypothetical protein EC930624_3873 [Escherichia coli 93.0624]
MQAICRTDISEVCEGIQCHSNAAGCGVNVLSGLDVRCFHV